jgi:glyoxylase-like metal-dependent hydrolase (beta-lactamase superfamily II)
MKIFPLSEGAFSIDKTKEFIPFDPATDNLMDRSRGSLLVEIQPFLVQTSTDLLLLDTGLGHEIDGQLQLHRLIKQAGFEPNAVTKVLMSHLHKDHVGGMGKTFPDGSRNPAFPKAEYYVQERELAYAVEKGVPSYHPDEFLFIRDFGNLRLLDGDGSIGDNISYAITGGHCPYHQVFHFEEEGEHIFFGGDVAPQAKQMMGNYVFKYDYDGRKCAELRQQWWEQGKKEGWTFLFYHDIKDPVYRFD